MFGVVPTAMSQYQLVVIKKAGTHDDSDCGTRAAIIQPESHAAPRRTLPTLVVVVCTFSAVPLSPAATPAACAALVTAF